MNSSSKTTVTSSSETSIQHIDKLNKLLWVIGVIGIIGVVALNSVLVVKLLPERYESALGDFPPPVIINKVPGIQGPAVKLGEVTVVRSDRCVNRDVQLTTTTIWVPDNAPFFQNSEQFRSPAMKGCATTTLALKMPEKVTAGKWFVNGVVRDDKSGDIKFWTSEVFVVVP